jgi:hypothetical protein
MDDFTGLKLSSHNLNMRRLAGMIGVDISIIGQRALNENSGVRLRGRED